MQDEIDQKLWHDLRYQVFFKKERSIGLQIIEMYLIILSWFVVGVLVCGIWMLWTSQPFPFWLPLVSFAIPGAAHYFGREIFINYKETKQKREYMATHGFGERE